MSAGSSPPASPSPPRAAPVPRKLSEPLTAEHKMKDETPVVFPEGRDWDASGRLNEDPWVGPAPRVARGMFCLY